jgi:excisionase family DNA binding protein
MRGNQYTTISEECQRLGVSDRYLRGLIKAGIIPCRRFGPKMLRLVPEEVDRAIEEQFYRGPSCPA